jgi:hypothetical protein
MYNCYNEALNYLIDRYGKKEAPSRKFNNKMAATYNPGKPVKLPSGETVLKMSDDDEEVERLVRQYNLGMAPKKELYYKLLSMGVIKEVEA